MAGPGADDPQVVTANFPCQLKEVITLPGNARVDCMVPQCGIICQAFFHLVIKNVDNVYFIVQVSGHSPVIAAEILEILLMNENVLSFSCQKINRIVVCLHQVKHAIKGVEKHYDRRQDKAKFDDKTQIITVTEAGLGFSGSATNTVLPIAIVFQ